jgi:hypothetical protein
MVPRVQRALFLIAMIFSGCGMPAPPTPDAGATVFIALEKDFTGWSQWQKFDLGDQPADTVHLAGHRVVYLSKAPPHGSTEFPIGTMLVKTVTPDTDGGTLQTFGMAKRGGDFNAQGAVNWEWFGLAPSDPPAIFEWRGAQPPESAGYGTVNGGACNTCHTGSAANDYVSAQQLSLGGF